MFPFMLRPVSHDDIREGGDDLRCRMNVSAMEVVIVREVPSMTPELDDVEPQH